VATQIPVDPKGSIGGEADIRYRRAIGIILCILAVLLTAFVWSGLSLNELLAAIPF
jgi:hypothetical protein